MPRSFFKASVRSWAIAVFFFGILLLIFHRANQFHIFLKDEYFYFLGIKLSPWRLYLLGILLVFSSSIVLLYSRFIGVFRSTRQFLGQPLVSVKQFRRWFIPQLSIGLAEEWRPSSFDKKKATQLFLLNVGSFTLLSLVVFSIYEEIVFYRFDGAFVLSVLEAQRIWLSADPYMQTMLLKGQGGMSFGALTHLIFGFSWILDFLTGGEVRPAMFMVAFSLQLFVATWLLGLAMKFKTSTSFIGAWACALITLPFFIPPLGFNRLTGNPAMIEVVAAAALILACFYQIGRHRYLFDIMFAALAGGLITHMAIAQPQGMIFSAPVIAATVLISVFSAENVVERKRKILFALIGMGICGISFGPYLFELFVFTQSGIYLPEFSDIKAKFSDSSFFFMASDGRRPLGIAFWLVALIGAILTAKFAGRQLRVSAIGFLVLVGTIFGSMAVFAAFNKSWLGPPVAYLDMTLTPQYGLFFACIVRCLLSAIDQRADSASYVNAHKYKFLFFVPWLAVLFVVPPEKIPLYKNQNPYFYPPSETTLTRLLEDKIALRPEQPYRGSVASFFGRSGMGHTPYSVPFYNQHTYDAFSLFFTGNDHRYHGLWHFNIPTLQTVNQLQSPYFHLATSRFFNLPQTPLVRTHTTLTKVRPNLLELMGVRYLIDDISDDHDLKLRASLGLPGNRVLRVFELDNPNVGQYSPTSISQVADLRSALDVLLKPDFDGREQVVTFQPVDQKLVPASRVEMQFGQGKIEVSATSHETSMIVLPITYSNCLVVDPIDVKSRDWRLIRVNILQTGLVFTGQFRGDIGFEFGLFRNRGCRLHDMRDSEELKIKDTLNYWPSRL